MCSINFRNEAVSEGFLLISCAGDGDTGGAVCLFDGEKLETVDRISTAGLTVFDGRLARLLRSAISTRGGEILIYDERGISHYLRVDELSDPHYMAWDGRCLITTSTGTNELLWIALSGEIERRWRAPGEGDSWHLNDLCIVDGELYASAFGRYTHYRDYKLRLGAGDGLIFQVNSGRTVANGLCSPHSPRYFDGAWTVCDSGRRSIVQIRSGQRTREASLRSFTRGMAVTDDYVIVGESAIRNSEQAMASFAILRRSDFAFVRRVELPFREVSEIVVVPAALAGAVKAGFRTNPLRVGETDQLQMFRDAGMEPRRLWAVSEPLTPSQFKIRIEADIPNQIRCGKAVLVDCTVTNLGDAFLCSQLPHPVQLSYQWKNALDSSPLDSGDGLRTPLPCMLPPGTSMQCRMQVVAPETEGVLKLVISLVQEGVAWFHEVDARNGYEANVTAVRPDPKPAEYAVTA
jgi:acetolactate synthase I/II/III large subunit